MAGADYAGVSAADVTVTVTDDDTAGVTLTPTTVSVAESGGTATYTVVLDTQPSASVTVTPTSGDPAAATVSGPLTFTTATWSTPQPVTVTGVNDARDNPAGRRTATITHTVTGADYAGVSAAAVTVTVTDIAMTTHVGDAINLLILPELVRSTVDTVNHSIAGRVAQAKHCVADTDLLAFSGRTVSAAPAAQGRTPGGGRGHSAKQLLNGMTFALPLSDADVELRCSTLWGRSAYRRIGGADDGRDLDWNSHLLSLQVGADTRIGKRLMAGASVAYSETDTEYTLGAETGDMEMQMTSVHPYLGWHAGEVDLWASFGYGAGDLEFLFDNGGKASSDVSMRTAAIGGSGPVAHVGYGTLQIKAVAQTSSLTVDGNANDDLSELDVDVRRVRVGVEWSERHTTTSGVWRSGLEAAGRYDGGDGRTGSGAEVGFSLGYIADAGLTLETRGHALLTHSGDYEDLGLGALIQYRPNLGGQGLSFRLDPGWGNTQRGTDRMWNDRPAALPVAAADVGGRLDSELAYGFAAHDGILTPYGGLRLTNGGRGYRIGGRFNRDGSPVRISLEAYRRTHESAATDNGVLLNAGMHW